jgi:hypothetical protein
VQKDGFALGNHGSAPGPLLVPPTPLLDPDRARGREGCQQRPWRGQCHRVSRVLLPEALIVNLLLWFWWNWDLNSGLHTCKTGALARVARPVHFALVILEMEVSGATSPGWPRTVSLLMAASRVAGITGVSLHAWQNSFLEGTAWRVPTGCCKEQVGTESTSPVHQSPLPVSDDRTVPQSGSELHWGTVGRTEGTAPR